MKERKKSVEQEVWLRKSERRERERKCGGPIYCLFLVSTSFFLFLSRSPTLLYAPFGFHFLKASSCCRLIFLRHRSPMAQEDEATTTPFALLQRGEKRLSSLRRRQLHANLIAIKYRGASQRGSACLHECIWSFKQVEKKKKEKEVGQIEWKGSNFWRQCLLGPALMTSRWQSVAAIWYRASR